MPTSRAARPPKHFAIPVNNSGHGNVLKTGHGVSVYYDLQPPNNWPEHQHPTAQIVLALDPVEAVMKWGQVGDRFSEATTIPHVWIVPPRFSPSVFLRSSLLRALCLPHASVVKAIRPRR